MSANSNNHVKNHAPASSPFGTSGIASPLPANAATHLHGQSQGPSQLAAAIQNEFQFSRVQAPPIQASHAQPHAIQASHAQFQAQLQAQGAILNQAQAVGSVNLGQSTSPGSALAKRGVQKPPVRPGPSMANIASSLKPAELPSAARKKKPKLPDKQLQEKVKAVLPESALYTQLLEFEARIDAAIHRKKVDIQEALKIPPSVQKTLRIYVFNTYANQVQSTQKKNNAEPPTWTLKIVGRILEDGADTGQVPAMQTSSSSYPKFSSFFKRVTVSLDQRLYPENHIISWEQARSPAPQDGFEVKRKGHKEFTINIRLEMNYAPEKFKLSSVLMDILGIEVDTRPRIIAAIWHYVKARKLQSPNDPSLFHCDAPLLKVFGEEKIKFTMVSQKISQHLSAPQPIHLEHQIKLSGSSPCGHACYDVLVDVPFPIQKELSLLLANTEKVKEIEACDDAIRTAIKKIHEHRSRRAFFLGFSQSPVEFINALVESQSKDLNLAAGESSRSAERERNSDFFSQPWVEDAVIRYLNRKSSGGNDIPGSA